MTVHLVTNGYPVSAGAALRCCLAGRPLQAPPLIAPHFAISVVSYVIAVTVAAGDAHLAGLQLEKGVPGADPPK